MKSYGFFLTFTLYVEPKNSNSNFLYLSLLSFYSIYSCLHFLVEVESVGIPESPTPSTLYVPTTSLILTRVLESLMCFLSYYFLSFSLPSKKYRHTIVTQHKLTFLTTKDISHLRFSFLITFHLMYIQCASMCVCAFVSVIPGFVLKFRYLHTRTVVYRVYIRGVYVPIS